MGPLDEVPNLEEITGFFTSGEVLEIFWISTHNLPRGTTGKWLLLKVNGQHRSKVAISQVIYRPQPYLLPLLFFLCCKRIGHSVNTCRAAQRCFRCNGPHLYKQGDTQCDRPYYCFQCSSPHGPRSAHCPHNQRAQQMYSSLASEKTHSIKSTNTFENCSFPSKSTHRQPLQEPVQHLPSIADLSHQT